MYWRGGYGFGGWFREPPGTPVKPDPGHVAAARHWAQYDGTVSWFEAKAKGRYWP